MIKYIQKIFLFLLIPLFGCSDLQSANLDITFKDLTPDVLVCANGLENCDGVCVDITNDAYHCGACNSPCNNGKPCFSGMCGLDSWWVVVTGKEKVLPGEKVQYTATVEYENMTTEDITKNIKNTWSSPNNTEVACDVIATTISNTTVPTDTKGQATFHQDAKGCKVYITAFYDETGGAKTGSLEVEVVAAP